MPSRADIAHIIGFPPGKTADHRHHIRGYLYACEAEGKTEATVTSYGWCLDRFQRAVPVLDLPAQPEAIEREHVRRYLAFLRREGLSITTVNDYLAVLRLWFKWLVAEGVCGADPTTGIAKARPDRKVLATITPAQVEDLLRLIKADGRAGAAAARKAQRDRAIVLVLYGCGLRANELVSLDLCDVDFERMVLFVRHGKGRKQRVIALGKAPRQALWSYVTRVRGLEDGPLFQSERGGARLLRTSLTQLLARLAQKSGWQDQRCSPHMFRRGFAVEFLRAGGDPFRLQLLLGHEKLDMTRLYSQALSQADAVDALQRLSPADRLRL